MKLTPFVKIFVVFLVMLFITFGVSAQRRGSSKPVAKKMVFAVLNDGRSIEPIGEIDKGALVAPMNGESDDKSLIRFASTYYRPKTSYNLIFGGKQNGSVIVKSSDPKAECSKSTAMVATQSPKAKIKGLVMALATNEVGSKTASGVRRLPTPAERTEIEALVRAEFSKQNMSPEAVAKMNYHNLTALDVNNDKIPEFVGTFWTANAPDERNMLFFIAEKDKSGRYELVLTDFNTTKKDEVMSGDLNDLDKEAIGHELLLDVMEYDGDDTAEIFTLKKAFEGFNYYVYSRRDGKWTNVFEGYNYHCGY